MKKMLKKTHVFLLLLLSCSVVYAIDTNKIETGNPWSMFEIQVPFKSTYTHNLHPTMKNTTGYPNKTKCEWDNLGRLCRVMVAQGGDIIKKQI